MKITTIIGILLTWLFFGKLQAQNATVSTNSTIISPSFTEDENTLVGHLGDGYYDTIVSPFGPTIRYCVTYVPTQTDQLLIQQPITLSSSANYNLSTIPASFHVSVYFQKFNDDTGSTSYDEFSLVNVDELNSGSTVKITDNYPTVPVSPFQYIPSLTISAVGPGNTTLQFSHQFNDRTIIVSVPVNVIP